MRWRNGDDSVRSRRSSIRAVRLGPNDDGTPSENPRPAYLGANALIALGDRDRAREWLSRAMAIDPDDVLTQYNIACGYSRLGEFGPAFDLLERLLPHANHETKSWVKFDSDLDALRNQPRYARILELIQ